MTNRERIQHVLAELAIVREDWAISPTPYSHLVTAAQELERAAEFVLDVNERDGVKTTSTC